MAYKKKIATYRRGRRRKANRRRRGEVLVAAVLGPAEFGRREIEREKSTRTRRTDVRRPESESDFLGRHRVARTPHLHAHRETAHPKSRNRRTDATGLLR